MPHTIIKECPEITINDIHDICLKNIGLLNLYGNPEKVYIATDAEWDTQILPRFKNWLQSATIVFYPYTNTNESVLWDYKIYVFSNTTIRNEISGIEQYLLSSKVQFCYQKECKQDDYILDDLLAEYPNLVKKTFQLVLKYSPLDVQAYYGTDEWSKLILEDKVVEQKRCLRFNTGGYGSKRKLAGEDYRVATELRDLQGLNTGSLKVQADSVGVKLIAKDSMDDYKTCMLKGYKAKPLTATLYNLSDTVQTMEIMLSYIPLINNIIVNDLKLPKHCAITEQGLRHTTGSLASYLLEQYIEYYPYIENPEVSQDDLDTWRLALRRLSIISDTCSSGMTKRASQIFKGMKECSTVQEYKDYQITYRRGRSMVTDSLYDLLLANDYNFKQLFGFKTYEQASVKYIGSDACKSLIYGATVQGGRCNNSFPDKLYDEYILDVDMSSCYGSTLRTLIYPIGLPTSKFKSLDEGQELETFDSIYKELEKELVDELWVADISTREKLNFNQDLIFSSLDLTPNKIAKAVGGTHYDDEGFTTQDIDSDIKKIPSTFSLERNRLEHSKLTSRTLEVITKVATDKEKKDIKDKFLVNNIIYYPKSKRVDSSIEWAIEILSKGGEIVQNDCFRYEDNRSRKWFGLPLEGLIGTLVQQRKVVKKERSNTDNENEKIALNGVQEMLKLFINTTYGVLASVYFSVGNVVLANVITDKARCGAWMMSKALHTRQEITDGGFYSPLAVPYFKPNAKKAGLQTLSFHTDWISNKNDKRYRGVKTLGDRTDWIELFIDYDKAFTNQDKPACKEFENLVDGLVKEHIEEFWGLYDLEFPFGLEHKYEHTAYKVTWMNKSDYGMDCVGGVRLIKKRGVRPHSEYNLSRGLVDNAGLGLIIHSLNNKGDISGWKNHPSHKTELLKIGKLLETTNPETLMLYAGQELVTEIQPIKLNNKHIPQHTLLNKNGIEVHTSDTIYKRNFNKKGKDSEGFEKFISEGTEVFLQKVMNNDLRESNYNK